MTPEKLRAFLNSLVLEADRDFVVEITEKTYRRRRAVYIHKSKPPVIRIYGGQDQPALTLICAGLHELAHHLNHKIHGELWRRMWRNGHSVPRHGPAFRKSLDALIGQWNFRYRELLRGLIVFDPKRPTRPPRFSPSP